MNTKETGVLARVIEINRRLRFVLEALAPMTPDDGEFDLLDAYFDGIEEELEGLESVVDDMESEREASIKEN